MSAPTTRLKCPACGLDVVVAAAPTPPTQWFACPRCHEPIPVLAPRELPPLYSWEALPGLYPMFPRPRPPRWRARRLAGVGLVGVVVLAAVFAGVLGYYAVLAGGPGSFTVSGTVLAQGSGGRVGPAAGAQIVLTAEGGRTLTTHSASDGTFLFTGVPAGGDSLNVTLPGFSPVVVLAFASPVYSAGTQGLVVTLSPGPVGNASTVALSAFPDLETLLASIGGATVLFGFVAAVAAYAALGTRRADRPALGIVGGGAGLAAPFTLYLLGLDAIFPLTVAATSAVAAVGAFVVALRAVELAQSGEVPAID